MHGLELTIECHKDMIGNQKDIAVSERIRTSAPERTAFRVQRLNHSATLTSDMVYVEILVSRIKSTMQLLEHRHLSSLLHPSNNSEG